MRLIRPKTGRLLLEYRTKADASRSCIAMVVGVNRAARCQTCLEVHHRQFRSQSRYDSEENLITLCVCCHGEMHIPRADDYS